MGSFWSTICCYIYIQQLPCWARACHILLLPSWNPQNFGPSNSLFSKTKINNLIWSWSLQTSVLSGELQAPIAVCWSDGLSRSYSCHPDSHKWLSFQGAYKLLLPFMKHPNCWLIQIHVQPSQGLYRLSILRSAMILLLPSTISHKLLTCSDHSNATLMPILFYFLRRSTSFYFCPLEAHKLLASPAHTPAILKGKRCCFLRGSTRSCAIFLDWPNYLHDS